jgi:hypothetical protein
MVSQTALRDRQVHELIRICPRVCDELLKLAVFDEKRCRRHDGPPKARNSTSPGPRATSVEGFRRYIAYLSALPVDIVKYRACVNMTRILFIVIMWYNVNAFFDQHHTNRVRILSRLQVVRTQQTG